MEFVRRVLRALRRSALGSRAEPQRGDSRIHRQVAVPAPAHGAPRARGRAVPPPSPQRPLRRRDPRDDAFAPLLGDVDAFVERNGGRTADDYDAFVERPQTLDQAQMFAELESLAERCNQIVSARARQPFRPPAAYRPGAQANTGTPEQRGIDLLIENLTPTQRRQFAIHRHFDVIGGQSGKRYRLWHRPMQNIEEFDANGDRVCVWCFHPRQPLVHGDVLLAQKTALELFESDALRIAHRYSDFAAYGDRPPPPRLRNPPRRILPFQQD